MLTDLPQSCSVVYEFGVKGSVATTLNRCKDGQFAVHAKALPRKPYDGHTLKTIQPDIEQFTGAAIKREMKRRAAC